MGVVGVVKQQIRGNDHPLPPTRSTPKPHLSNVIWGVLSLFLMPDLNFLVVFVVNLRFECGGLAIEKVRFQPFGKLEGKKIEDFFGAPWSIQRACIDQKYACSSGKSLSWTL